MTKPNRVRSARLQNMPTVIAPQSVMRGQRRDVFKVVLEYSYGLLWDWFTN